MQSVSFFSSPQPQESVYPLPLVLRSSLMLSFPPDNRMGVTYLPRLQALAYRSIHTNEERSTSQFLNPLKYPRGVVVEVPRI